MHAYVTSVLASLTGMEIQGEGYLHAFNIATQQHASA